MQVSKNFDLREFIDPVTWKEQGEKSLDLIDYRLIEIAQFVRDSVGKPVFINTWHKEGPGHKYKERGLRRSDTTTGAKRSAHKEGKAIDLDIQGMDGPRSLAWAKKNKKALFDLGVRQIEDDSITPGWLHLSTRDKGQKGIQIIDRIKVVETWEV